jgi:hypothetical protein
VSARCLQAARARAGCRPSGAVPWGCGCSSAAPSRCWRWRRWRWRWSCCRTKSSAATASTREGLRKNQAQIAARLRHPTGQLALLNPQRADQPATPLRPLVLPFAAHRFRRSLQGPAGGGDGRLRAAVPGHRDLCAGIGANPYAGGFIYVVASLRAPALVAHQPGDLELQRVHRAWRQRQPARAEHALDRLPEISADGRGRLVGMADELPIKPGSKPVRDFRGWLWQETRCAEAGSDAADCPRRSFLSLRLPIEAFREALAARQPVWPPPDLAQIEVHLKLLPPGDGPPLFDSDAPGAVPPLDLAELRALAAAGRAAACAPRRRGDRSGGHGCGVGRTWRHHPGSIGWSAGCRSKATISRRTGSRGRSPRRWAGSRWARRRHAVLHRSLAAVAARLSWVVARCSWPCCSRGWRSNCASSVASRGSRDAPCRCRRACARPMGRRAAST